MDHKIVSQDEWLAAHSSHLVKEKELTRLRDELSAARRALPWVKVEKPYVFDTPGGRKTFSGLFAGRSQLIVKHFMFGPDWKEGCAGCSFECDHIDGALVHLEHHGVTYVAVARAPLPDIEAFKTRMGWRFNWVSSFGSDFNYDFCVSFTKEQISKGEVNYNFGLRDFQSEEMSGISVFYKDTNGDIFHTFSAYGRGAEELLGTYMALDLTPKGRNETGPNFDLSDWVRHHDRYGEANERKNNMTSKIFVNLAVKDLDQSQDFFATLGYKFNPQFTDKTAACMVISDEIYAMLCTEPKFKEFTKKEIADARKTTEVLTCLSVDSKAKVDEIVDIALKSGATKAGEPLDHGFMYGRSFNDLDGHIWEYIWMDPAAINKEPVETRA